MFIARQRLKPYTKDYLEWSKGTDEDKLKETARLKYIMNRPRLTESERLQFLKRKHYGEKWEDMQFAKVSGNMRQAMQSGLPSQIASNLGSQNISVNGTPITSATTPIFFICYDQETRKYCYGSEDYLSQAYGANLLDLQRAANGDDNNTVTIRQGMQLRVVSVYETSKVIEVLSTFATTYKLISPNFMNGPVPDQGTKKQQKAETVEQLKSFYNLDAEEKEILKSYFKDSLSPIQKKNQSKKSSIPGVDTIKKILNGVKAIFVGGKFIIDAAITSTKFIRVCLLILNAVYILGIVPGSMTAIVQFFLSIMGGGNLYNSAVLTFLTAMQLYFSSTVSSLAFVYALIRGAGSYINTSFFSSVPDLPIVPDDAMEFAILVPSETADMSFVSWTFNTITGVMEGQAQPPINIAPAVLPAIPLVETYATEAATSILSKIREYVTTAFTGALDKVSKLAFGEWLGSLDIQMLLRIGAGAYLIYSFGQLCHHLFTSFAQVRKAVKLAKPRGKSKKTSSFSSSGSDTDNESDSGDAYDGVWTELQLKATSIKEKSDSEDSAEGADLFPFA
jgi:hypothetical protein